MAKFSEMGFGARFLAVFVITLLAGAAYYYTYLNNEIEKNQQIASRIADKKAENDRLREFEPKLKQLEREMAILEQQIEREKKVVPDDKNSDQFIRLLHDTAATAGIEIRRYTAQPTANHEFYSEVPFAIDIDGPYYSVLNFFQKVSELERIVNIDNLQVANAKTPGPSKVKTTYTYSPGETIVASCTASTFYSHDPEPAPPAKPGQPGQPGQAVQPGQKAPPPAAPAPGGR